MIKMLEPESEHLISVRAEAMFPLSPHISMTNASLKIGGNLCLLVD